MILTPYFYIRVKTPATSYHRKCNTPTNPGVRLMAGRIWLVILTLHFLVMEHFCIRRHVKVTGVISHREGVWCIWAHAFVFVDTTSVEAFSNKMVSSS